MREERRWSIAAIAWTVGFAIVSVAIATAAAWPLYQSPRAILVGAVGGLVGTLTYGWITQRVSLANLMRIGLIVETLTHLALALTRTAWVAMVIFVVFGAHVFIWGTTSMTVRQRAVPSALQGRVGSLHTICLYGGLVAGSAIGGLLATHYGVAAPFWFAFAGSAVFVVVLWRGLTAIAHADDAAQPAPH